MRLFLYLAIGGLIIFLFQNCQELTGIDNDKNGEQKLVVKIADLNQFDSLELGGHGYFYQQSLLPNEYIRYNNLSKKIEIASPNNGGQVKLCTTPDDILFEIESLWARASICHTQFILEPNAVRCMAMSVPYAALSNQNEQLALVKTICQHDETDLCDAADQATLHEIINEIRTRQNSLTCGD